MLRPFYQLAPEQWLISPEKANLEGQSLEKELIRQWVLSEIIYSYHYPQDWLGKQIQLIDFEGDIDQNVILGIRILNSSGFAFILIAVDLPNSTIGHAEECLRQMLASESFAGLGLVTDGTQSGTRFLRYHFGSSKCDIINDLESYFTPTYSKPKPHIKPSGRTYKTLSTLTDRVENVFFEVHSHIRDIDGLHADEALDEFCKIIYAKLYDEEITEVNKPFRMQRWISGSVEELASMVRGIYQEANEYDLRVYNLRIPGYDRSRGVFNAPIRLSSPALAKVVETLQDYDLTRSNTDIKGRAFQKVLSPSIRAGMGQYFTPDPIVELMIQVIAPRVSELVLDPFAGSGHFLSASLDWVQKSEESVSDKKLHEFAFGQLHGIEKSDRMVRIAMTDMRLHGDGHSNIRCTDSLLAFSNYPDLQPESFDIVVTNPPFGSLLGEEAITQLGRFELAIGRRKVPLEILGFERCIQFLRPGGRIGIVLPDGVISNRNTRYVREWVENYLKLRAIISLPVEAFSPFGANVKTSILFARKWRPGENKTHDYPILVAQSDNIGYDAAGRARNGSEIEELVFKVRAFLEHEGW